MQPGQWDQRLKRSTQCLEALGAFYPDRAPLSLTGYCSTSAPHPAYVPRLPVASSMTGFSMHVSPLGEGWAASESAEFAISWHRRKHL